MASTTLQRVYVWELPVRAFHWLNAFCIVVLGLTGFLIGHPVAFNNSSEASFSYWFGTVRFLHFATAYVLTFAFLIRIYWAFKGNRYASWRNFLLVTRAQWAEVASVLKFDVLQARGKPLGSVGHNALASLVYFASFLVFLAQVATGFGLYSAMSGAFLPTLFAWVPALFGGDFDVRHVHHVLMWFFPIFLLVHVYLTAYHDYVEGRGVVSSMVGGWKFIEAPREEGKAP